MHPDTHRSAPDGGQRWRRFRLWLAARPSALPLALLLLALSTLFLFGHDRAYFYRSGHHDWNSSRALSIAENLSLKHNLLGFHYLSRNASGDQYYHRHAVYNRFPMGGFALIKLAILPYGEEAFQAKIYAARMLLLLLFSAAAVLAYHSLARIIGSRWDALAATLLAFSSYYMLYYSDMIFNEVTIDLFGVMLAFHGMVIFVQERSFRQLLLKCCLALLLGWHVYAFLLPFIGFGLASELFKSHRAFSSRGPVSVARRLKGYAISILRSRYPVLGIVTLLFGITVLTFNLANEYLALDGEVPLRELPSVQSATRRLGGSDLGAHHSARLEPQVFIVDQAYRVGNMMLPYAVNPYTINDRVNHLNYRGLPLVALGALTVGICLAGLAVIRRRSAMLLPLATLAVSGLCWAALLRNQVVQHDLESVFYIGLSLTAFTFILLCLRRFSRIRLAPFLGVSAIALFAFSAAAMAGVGESRAQLAKEAEQLADYAAIRNLINDGAAVYIQWSPYDARFGGAAWASQYFLAGKTLIYEYLGKSRPGKQAGDYLLLPTRKDGPALLTPTNRHIFLYDWSLYNEHHNTDDMGILIIENDWNVYLKHDRLTYISQECAHRDDAFFLHFVPEHPLYLPERRREYGYDNHDFLFQVVGRVRRDGACIVEYPHPGYDIVEIRTGQYSTDGQIWNDNYLVPDEVPHPDFSH